jgi:hypothetical protein
VTCVVSDLIYVKAKLIYFDLISRSRFELLNLFGKTVEEIIRKPSFLQLDPTKTSEEDLIPPTTDQKQAWNLAQGLKTS